MTKDVGWLLALAMVAGVNPLRLGGRLPAERVAAAGALISAAVYLLLGASARSLLHAIDVSVPTMVVAAGLVLIAGATRDLLVGPPAPEPALDGWGAALVPVAVPMLVRPQVGVLALAAGPEGLGPIAAGAGAAVALTVAVSSLNGPLTLRVMDWASVVTSVAALALGVALTVAGVLSV